MRGRAVEMRHVREALRLAASGASRRRIVQCVGVARSTIGQVLDRAAAAGLSWPLPEDMPDEALAAALFKRKTMSPNLGVRRRQEPDWAALHLELKRPHVTLMLLWEEHRAEAGDKAYGYSRFCDLYRTFEARLSPSMRQTHAAGDKMFVDYAGATVPVLVDRITGQTRAAQIFVAALGASNLTYAEASWTQSSADWVGAHVHALDYFGGAPNLVVADNLKETVRNAGIERALQAAGETDRTLTGRENPRPVQWVPRKARRLRGLGQWVSPRRAPRGFLLAPSAWRRKGRSR